MTTDQLAAITETATPEQRLADAVRHFVNATSEAEQSAARVDILHAASQMTFEVMA
jgi:hypothetical protein